MARNPEIPHDFKRRDSAPSVFEAITVSTHTVIANADRPTVLVIVRDTLGVYLPQGGVDEAQNKTMEGHHVQAMARVVHTNPHRHGSGQGGYSVQGYSNMQTHLVPLHRPKTNSSALGNGQRLALSQDSVSSYGFLNGEQLEVGFGITPLIDRIVHRIAFHLGTAVREAG
jgi:hypothetical protein